MDPKSIITEGLGAKPFLEVDSIGWQFNGHGQRAGNMLALLIFGVKYVTSFALNCLTCISF